MSAPISWTPGGWNYPLHPEFRELTGDALSSRSDPQPPGIRNPSDVTSASQAGTDYYNDSGEIAYIPLGLTGEATQP